MNRLYSLSYLTLEMSPPDMLRLAAKAGYSHIGVRLLPAFEGGKCFPLMNSKATMKETLDTIKASGVQVFDIEIIRLNGTRDEPLWERIAAAARELGARTIIAAGDDKDEARLVSDFARLCEIAAPYDLSINLEFTPWTSVPDAKTALKIVRSAAQPNGELLVDTLHAARSDTSLNDLANLPSDILSYVQICDGKAEMPPTMDALIFDARSARLLPGEGGIKIEAMLNALPQNLPVSVETPHLKRLAEVGAEAWITEALEKSKQVVERADRQRSPAA